VILLTTESILRQLIDGERNAKTFCPDVSLYAKFNDVYKSYLGAEYSARAFVGSGPRSWGAFRDERLRQCQREESQYTSAKSISPTPTTYSVRCT
jgi:hypothetical protein